ncbi:hypothetical protein NOR53_3518 [gamma proteobacterium NOR5-3]|nr:hypothetical protein NOR53_3518 [gamma proteobacterium NOR5-3]
MVRQLVNLLAGELMCYEYLRHARTLSQPRSNTKVPVNQGNTLTGITSNWDR